MIRARAAAMLLVAGVLAGASAPMRAQAPRGEEEPGITGYVLGPGGAPVSAGTVFAQGVGAATIDRTGRFRLVPPRSGAYQLLISVPGMRPYRLSADVPSSKSLRLPIVHLVQAAYYRVRLVSAAGEPITSPQLRRRSFDISGKPMFDWPGDRDVVPLDGDGAVTIGPLPQGTMTVALDMPPFAQTRLPDLNFGDAGKVVDGGTIVIQQPGAVLDVDVIDGAGAPVPNHPVFLDDVRPRSPLVFRPAETDQQGRATFEHVGPGRYRAWAAAVDACDNVRLLAGRVVAVSGGTVETPLVVGGRATFRVRSPLGPLRGVPVAASPDVPTQPLPGGYRRASPACRGVTDGDGRVTLGSFPPGPARLEVRMANSIYVRQVEVPADSREIAVGIPDGVLPVHVVDAATNQPVAGAALTWAGAGGRVEAAATSTGDALLEGVGTTGGTLTISAQHYQPAEEPLTELPPFLHAVALTPLPPAARLPVRVTTISGEALPNAMVALMPANEAAVLRVAATDAKGIVAFSDLPPGSLQLVAAADGYAASAMAVGQPVTGEVVFTLSPGFRAIASVDLPATEGPQVVRVVSDAGVAIEDLLDLDSDRGVDPPGRLSLGPLAPGAYVIELQGARGRRQQPIRIVDRNVAVTFR